MQQRLVAAVVCLTLCLFAFDVQTQSPQTQSPQAPQPSADPYANNAAPGTSTFPLAAPAGTDSNARLVAPAGSVNQGAFNP